MIDLNELQRIAENSHCRDGQLIEVLDRAIAAESERDELKEKLAEIEKQEPFVWLWIHENGKVASDIFNTEDEAVSCWKSYSGRDNAIPMYAQSNPSASAQRITEQDARNIITAHCNYLDDDSDPIPDFEWFAPDWQKSMRTLLAKLNEHREPVQEAQPLAPNHSEPYAYAITGRNIDMVAKLDSVAALNKDHPEWKVTPLYLHESVTANKAEVPEGWKLFPEHPTKEMQQAGSSVKIFTGYNGMDERVYTNTTFTEIRDIYERMFEAAPLPPLKDGE